MSTRAQDQEAHDHGFETWDEYVEAVEEYEADKKYHAMKEDDYDRWEARMNRI